MPQTNSAKKALRQTVKRTAKNKQIKKSLSDLMRDFKKAVTASDKKKAEEISKKIIKALDKSAQKNIIKKNKAARKKSRTMKKLNSIK